MDLNLDPPKTDTIVHYPMTKHQSLFLEDEAIQKVETVSDVEYKTMQHRGQGSFH